jgi:DNA-binding beta-propeller fold protein YncE
MGDIAVTNEVPVSRTSRLERFLLPLTVTFALAACGGGGGGGGGGGQQQPTPPPQAQIADGQLTPEKIQGLGFTAAGASAGSTNADGRFQFVVGQPLEFFLGNANNRLKIGTVTLTPVAGGVATTSLQNLAEVQNDQDQYLGNLLALLVALDANANPLDGISIDAATNTAVSTAVAGKTVNFNQAADAFKADPVIAALLTALNRQLGDAKTALADYTELFPQSRTSSIALTSDNTRVVVVNRQKSTASVLRVRAQNGADVAEKLSEVPVGGDSRYVAISPDDKRAFVTSAITGDMTVIDLTLATPAAVGTPIKVGLEPRGIAITPNGTYAFIANYTVGEVTVVRLSTLEVVRSIKTGGNPQAVAITNDGDKNDLDEQVYVTRMFSEVIDPARPDGFDDAKQGVIDTFKVGAAVDGSAQAEQLYLKPFNSGFFADRRQFCQGTRDALENAGQVIFFNSGKNADKNAPGDRLDNNIFCPDASGDSTDITVDGPIQKVAAKVYPNMLHSALIRGRNLYLPNVGASPEPPVNFNTNVQGLVGVINRPSGLEDDALTLNLNAQVAKERKVEGAEAFETLDRLFLNDLVAVDADRAGRNFLFVSRGGNYVLRAGLDQQFKLNILDAGAPPKAARIQTGNMPTGVVMSSDGARAYVNNEINLSITALNLADNTVIGPRDIESSEPLPLNSLAHRNLVGKLVFFTALGVPDVMNTQGDANFDIPLRDIDPLKHRGKASDNAWSSCASCHDDGRTDNVTWIFETGPRQSIGLDGTFTHDVQGEARLADSRALNWSAVRSSNTDFNNNARGIQGGKGFATDVNGVDRSGLVFNHGPVFGISDSLDALQQWATTVRALIVPDVADDTKGREVFAANCASCHGGAKWTKSQATQPTQSLETQLYALGLVNGRPAAFLENPIGAKFFDGPNDANGVKPFDFISAQNGLQAIGPQLQSVVRPGKTLKFLDDVGTFDPANPLEIRGAAAVGAPQVNGQGPGVQSTQGFGAFGAAGFNSPSLLGLSASAPYFHDGSALTLEEVMARHELDNDQTIAERISAADLAKLLEFIRSIDDATQPFTSAADEFLGNP